MRILVDVGHPAHVHFFKNFVWEMEKRGHHVLVVSSDKDVAIELLEHYGFRYLNLGSYGRSTLQKMFNVPVMDFKMFRAGMDFKPDIFLGIAAIRAAHVASLLKKPCLIFDDTEHSKHEQMLYTPFAHAILTPDCFLKDMGAKHLRYSGFHELAYLHPAYFRPDVTILKELGLREEDRFTTVRFVSWGAVHDIGQQGITDRIKLVKGLEKHGRVLVTAEGKLERDLEPYRISIPPEKLHDLMYYASLHVGEGAKTAVESAILGTPSIFVSSLATKLGYPVELEEKYQLMFNYTDLGLALQKATDLIRPGLKSEWKEKRHRLFDDKINVTDFMVWLVEQFPRSLREVKDNPDIQKRFR